ncbi:apoptosis-stimulating of p53 protein 2-like [Notothenia coriiceps]|uniref:Apoptosis-stimulating of p53 protein 2-like n=1 Tax=Notothenia coriiceps TaxID=8208 RepID=A0A6I9MU69_9TELE|nr:PREDICTED: apoptosis-stimulating of p53 protein 2-like [Notothenia coriiceps]
MRYEAKMMPMFLTVYLSNNDQHFTEVPVTPETLCRDVVELCKEPGEADCHLAEMWRGSERAVGDGERMLDVLQRWGQHRAEVRFFLRHNRAPSRESGGSRGSEQKRNGVKAPPDRRMENGVVTPRMDMTLSELQEMASRQQQQIDSQQQLLASKEQRLRYLKQQEQRQQQQASEQEKLQRLRENIENQETRLKKVRALKGQVEQKRLSNGKLVEEIDQMNNLFQQKQRELVMAATKVEDLSLQLELLKNGKMDNFNDNQSSVAELDRLYKELQLRNKLNQDQNSKLQQQRDGLNKRNMEVAAMDKRIIELRDRLWKKKAALQQKENLPPQIPWHSEPTHSNNGYPGKERASKDTHLQVPTDGPAGQQSGPSRVAAVGPYIQSSTMPRGPVRHELLVKPAYPDGTATLPAHDPQSKAGPGLQPSKLADWGSSGPESNTNGHGSSSTLPRMTSHSNTEQDETETRRDKKVRPLSMFESTDVPATSLRKNQSSDDLVRDAKSAPKGPVKVPPPVPTKPKGPGVVPYGKPGLNTGTFPKAKPHSQQPQPPQGRSPLPSSQSQTLPLPSKQDAPPAATVRPFTPELPSSKPQTLAASSIYSMYTQQAGSAKPFHPPSGVQNALNRNQSRSNGFVSVYGGNQADPQWRACLRRPGVVEAFPQGSMRQSWCWFLSGSKMKEQLGLGLRGRGGAAPFSELLGDLQMDWDPPYPSGAEQDSLGEDTFNMKAPEVTGQVILPPGKRTNLRKLCSERIDHSMRVKFNPLALLLDSSLEGEFDLVQRIIYEVEDPSLPNDEGITALHNAVCAGHTEIVKFLVQFGVNVNAADSDGWTPLHCAASCNNVQVCKFLVESGAAVFAMTYSDMQTAADKCEEMEEGYTQCSQFLYGVQEKMGIMNRGVIYGLWEYNGENPDELVFREGDCMTIVRREDEDEIEWWWARMGDTEGYIPRNLLGLYPRIKPRQRTLA